MSNETNYQREDRIRLEEQRVTRLEDSYTAVHELLKEVRKAVEIIGKQLAEHAHKDEETFTSIDNRLQSLSSQLVTLNTTLIAAQTLETNVLSLNLKVGTIYTEQGLNKVEVLWKESQNKQVRDAVYKEWWAWLCAGLLGGVALASGALNLIDRVFGG
jgi:hypothetical protein